jgi:hypothetical protein
VDASIGESVSRQQFLNPLAVEKRETRENFESHADERSKTAALISERYGDGAAADKAQAGAPDLSKLFSL